MNKLNWRKSKKRRNSTKSNSAVEKRSNQLVKSWKGELQKAKSKSSYSLTKNVKLSILTCQVSMNSQKKQNEKVGKNKMRKLMDWSLEDLTLSCVLQLTTHGITETYTWNPWKFGSWN